ncbi:MAG: hypothetical protein WBM40_14150 [Thiohalocapsa sp.]
MIAATSEPYLTGWIDALRQVFPKDIVRDVAKPKDIERCNGLPVNRVTGCD